MDIPYVNVSKLNVAISKQTIYIKLSNIKQILLFVNYHVILDIMLKSPLFNVQNVVLIVPLVTTHPLLVYLAILVIFYQRMIVSKPANPNLRIILFGNVKVHVLLDIQLMTPNKVFKLVSINVDKYLELSYIILIIDVMKLLQLLEHIA